MPKFTKVFSLFLFKIFYYTAFPRARALRLMLTAFFYFRFLAFFTFLTPLFFFDSGPERRLILPWT